MIKFFRTILFCRPAKVSRQEAEAIARTECLNRGWPWIEPVRVNEGLTHFHVMTNTRCRGGNVNLRVNVSTGEVSQAAFADR
jgi:hypothetical protein